MCFSAYHILEDIHRFQCSSQQEKLSGDSGWLFLVEEVEVETMGVCAHEVVY